MEIFAHIALLSWPLVCVAIFLNSTPTRATLYSLLGSMLFLPMRTGYDLPGLPYVGKEEMATLGVLAGLMIVAPRRLLSAAPFGRQDMLTWLLLAGAMATALTNGDPLEWGVRAGTKLKAYDGLSYMVGDILRIALPFMIGRALFQTRRDMRELLLFISVGGLVYSVVALIEMRMSPQFHDWLYGFHQIHFRNVYRLGGYRPKGLMWNGLAFSLFILASAIAMAVLERSKIKTVPIPALARFTSVYQAVILVLCRSFGSIIYGFASLPLVWWFRSRTVMRLALCLCAIVLAYPLMRTLDVFPTTTLVEQAKRVDAARAQSLEFRFKNEDLLLAKALERPVFGWGSSGRARVYDEYDGDDITTTDGTWIIRLGSRGLVGWIALFGFLLLPIWMSRKSLEKRDDERDRIQLAGLTLILSLYCIDLVPNALFTNFPIFLGGALYGISRNLARAPKRSRRKKRILPSAPRRQKKVDRAEGPGQRQEEPAVRTQTLWTQGGHSRNPLDR